MPPAVEARSPNHWTTREFPQLAHSLIWFHVSFQLRLTKSNFPRLENLSIFFKFIYLFIYLWLCWVFVSVRGLSLVAASGGRSSSRCAGLSLSRPLLLQSTGSRRAGSVIVAHGPSCSAAMWDLPRPGLEPMSPALAGRFSTTAPPGKPSVHFLSTIINSKAQLG